MAATKGKSGLAAKFGTKLNNVLKEQGSAPTTYGLISLPGGIKNGIAQVSKCYFKEFDKSTNMKKLDGSSAAGEWFFRCEGTIITPDAVETADGIIPVRGLVTSVMVPILDSKDKDGNVTPQEAAFGKVLNYMRQVTDDKFTENVTTDDLEALAAAIEEAAPYFWFSTSTVKAQPPKYMEDRVFENWHGNRGLQNYQPEDATATAFNEQTTVPPATVAPPVTKAPVTQPTKVIPPTAVTAKPTLTPAKTTFPAGSAKPMPAQIGANKPPTPPVTATTPVNDGSDDLDGLVTLAESEFETSTDAQQKLEDLALAAGYTLEEIQALDVGWADVKNMIENPKVAEGGDEATKPVPVVGETCKYTPPGKDARTKKPYKERDCKIISVDEAKQIVNIKDLTSNMQYEATWDEIK